MPFLNIDELQGTPVLIGRTEFVHPDNEEEQVNLDIYLAGPKFDNGALDKDFGSISPDFVQNLKNYVHSFPSLEEKVAANKGQLKLTLCGHTVTLEHRKHFFTSAKDK